MLSRRERRSYLPEVQEQLRLREELKREALPTAAYCRLSVLDMCENSIETQINIVHTYIDENPELTLAGIYIDNGYSGINFDRPDWERLMNDVQNGKISCIVVKDLSRFGRNHIETGYYIESIFPKIGVRFISITDNFDSEADNINDGFLIPARNMMNSLYARDISYKTRTSMENMKRQGLICNDSAPYGYSCKEGRLIINPEEAPMVQMIFKWAKLNTPAGEIAYRLNLMGAVTRNGNEWRAEHILNILRNKAYIGTIITGRVVYQMNSAKKMPEETWRVFERMHEPIISRDDFDLVNELFKPESRGTRKKNPLYELTFCGACGKKMKLVRDRFYCQRHTGQNATEERLNHIVSILEKELKGRVIRKCKAYLKELEEIKPTISRAERAGGILANITLEAIAAYNEKQKLVDENELLYTHLCEGNLNVDEYDSARRKLNERLREKQASLNTILSRQRKVRTTLSSVMEFIRTAEEIDRVNIENVQLLVDRIDVLPSGYTKIRMKHGDNLEALRNGSL